MLNSARCAEYGSLSSPEPSPCLVTARRVSMAILTTIDSYIRITEKPGAFDAFHIFALGHVINDDQGDSSSDGNKPMDPHCTKTITQQRRGCAPMNAHALPIPANALIQHMPAYSLPGRTVAPLARKIVRPLTDLIPVHDRILRHAHLFDLVGTLLPAPRGASVEYRKFDGFDAELVIGAGVDPRSDGRVLYFHGGGFVVGGLRSHRRLVARISAAAGVPALQVNYRQLPLGLLSGAIADGLTAYRAVLAEGVHSSKIVFAGDSAGGYLAFVVAQQAFAQGLPTPAGIAALSPWLDLAGEHSSLHGNVARDALIPLHQMRRIAALLADPGCALPSVLNSDLSFMPPVLVQVSSTELMLSDAERITDLLSAVGVESNLQVWDNQIHVFQILSDIMPEARDAITQIGDFTRSRIGKPGRRSQMPKNSSSLRRRRRKNARIQ